MELTAQSVQLLNDGQISVWWFTSSFMSVKCSLMMSVWSYTHFSIIDEHFTIINEHFTNITENFTSISLKETYHSLKWPSLRNCTDCSTDWLIACTRRGVEQVELTALFCWVWWPRSWGWEWTPSRTSSSPSRTRSPDKHGAQSKLILKCHARYRLYLYDY